jgi:hypothetical protein
MNYRHLLVAIVIVLFILNTQELLAQKTKKQPNIILIIADDLGYGDTVVMANKKLKRQISTGWQKWVCALLNFIPGLRYVLRHEAA